MRERIFTGSRVEGTKSEPVAVADRGRMIAFRGV